MNNFIRKRLRESLLQLENYEDLDELYEKIFDAENEVIWDYIAAIEREKPTDENPLKARQPWEVIPFSALQRQWEEYMKWGFVKPNYEKTILGFQKIFIENTFKVGVNTKLAGHSMDDPTHMFLDAINGTRYDNENKDEFVAYLEEWFPDYITEDHGQIRISDYGLPKLEKLVVELYRAHDINKKLPIMDRMLNVIHMRSDIAEWFVEGGTSSLSKLSGEIK